jgi:hypothetical protein
LLTKRTFLTFVIFTTLTANCHWQSSSHCSVIYISNTSLEQFQAFQFTIFTSRHVKCSLMLQSVYYISLLLHCRRRNEVNEPPPPPPHPPRLTGASATPGGAPTLTRPLHPNPRTRKIPGPTPPHTPVLPSLSLASCCIHSLTAQFQSPLSLPLSTPVATETLQQLSYSRLHCAIPAPSLYLSPSLLPFQQKHFTSCCSRLNCTIPPLPHSVSLSLSTPIATLETLQQLLCSKLNCTISPSPYFVSPQ